MNPPRSRGFPQQRSSGARQASGRNSLVRDVCASLPDSPMALSVNGARRRFGGATEPYSCPRIERLSSPKTRVSLSVRRSTTTTSSATEDWAATKLSTHKR